MPMDRERETYASNRRDRPVEILHQVRERIADRIERDIALLDALDSDPDFEDDADAEATAAEWVGRGAHRFTRGGAA